MSNVTPFKNGGLTSVDAMRKSLVGLSASAAPQGGLSSLNGKELLKLEKSTGEWVFGLEGDELDGNIAINPTSFCHGLIAWGEGVVLGETMVSMNEPMPQLDEMPDVGAKYNQQLSFEAAIVDGPDAGTQLIYKTTALGGKEFVGKLAATIAKRLDEDPQAIVPVVELSESHYKHKQWGRIYKPEFDIVGWNAFGDTTPPPAPEPEPAEEAPKKRARKRRS